MCVTQEEARSPLASAASSSTDSQELGRLFTVSWSTEINFQDPRAPPSKTRLCLARRGPSLLSLAFPDGPGTRCCFPGRLSVLSVEPGELRESSSQGHVSPERRKTENCGISGVLKTVPLPPPPPQIPSHPKPAKAAFSHLQAENRFEFVFVLPDFDSVFVFPFLFLFLKTRAHRGAKTGLSSPLSCTNFQSQSWN